MILSREKEKEIAIVNFERGKVLSKEKQFTRKRLFLVDVEISSTETFCILAKDKFDAETISSRQDIEFDRFNSDMHCHAYKCTKEELKKYYFSEEEPIYEDDEEYIPSTCLEFMEEVEKVEKKEGLEIEDPNQLILDLSYD